jgi:hypothetical protein
LEFSSYFWFLQESQKIGRQKVASPCDARSEQQVCCLLADQWGKNQREESRGKERLVAVEQSSSVSKLGWPALRNDACARVVWHSHA